MNQKFDEHCIASSHSENRHNLYDGHANPVIHTEALRLWKFWVHCISSVIDCFIEKVWDVNEKRPNNDCSDNEPLAAEGHRWGSDAVFWPLNVDASIKGKNNSGPVADGSTNVDQR